MEQRRLRLGDILDDYCPRERRVTNHAVVAMIEEDVKQTRCTTCDAEHAYKGARVPARRKKETTAALFKEVLAGMPELDDVPVLAAAPAVVVTPVLAVVAMVPPAALSAHDEIAARGSREELSAPMHKDDDTPVDLPPLSDLDAEGGSDDAPAVDGPVHRPLIRATLPRIEGHKEARPATDFTIRQTPPRGNGHGGFRPDRDRMHMRSNGGNGNGNAYGHGNGNRSNGNPRFQGNRPPGGGRSAMGRAGGPPSSGFRGHGNGNGNGNGNKRGRGSRG